MLWYFNGLDSAVKVRLIKAYCTIVACMPVSFGICVIHISRQSVWHVDDVRLNLPYDSHFTVISVSGSHWHTAFISQDFKEVYNYTFFVHICSALHLRFALWYCTLHSVLDMGCNSTILVI